LVELSRATVDPSQYPDELFDHFSIPAYDDGRVAVREPGSKIKSTKFLVSRESVLISKLNPHIPRVWLPASREDARAIASTEFLVVSARRPFTREFLYTLLSSPHFTEGFASRVTGTSGSHQRVKPADLLAMRVRVPGEGDIEELSGVLRTLLDRAQLAIDESRNLAATRDALLPRLLSGEQRVRDMERGVEMAV
jgi:type I restriction enzyme S subunit